MWGALMGIPKGGSLGFHWHSLGIVSYVFVNRLPSFRSQARAFPYDIDTWLVIYCQGTRMRWDSPACGRSYQRLHGCMLTARHASTSEEISPEKQAKVHRISIVSKIAENEPNEEYHCASSTVMMMTATSLGGGRFFCILTYLLKVINQRFYKN